MSILIKGFDTDGYCLHCFFQSEDADRCLLTNDDIPLYGKGHPESCPLVPLPEKHGRLIDADALYEVAKTRSMGIYGPCDYQCVITGNNILKAPTIVPAEGGGEDG